MNLQVSLFPRVFVYGTLKKGFAAHDYLANARYLGELFLPEFAMRYNPQYPAAIKTGRVAHHILGEVFELAGEECKHTLARLDGYEGISHGLFKREEVVTAMYGKVFIYTQDMPTYTYQWVPSGIWEGGIKTKCEYVAGGGLPPTPEERRTVSQPENKSPIVTATMLPKVNYVDPIALLYGKIDILEAPKKEA